MNLSYKKIVEAFIVFCFCFFFTPSVLLDYVVYYSIIFSKSSVYDKTSSSGTVPDCSSSYSLITVF